MQRMKTIRWPSRNPMGDSLYYKAIATFGQTVNIASGSSHADIIPVSQTNNMPVLAAIFGDAPGLRQLGSSFDRYRISGLTVKHTVWPQGLAGDLPVYLYTNAGAHADDVPVPSINTTPELRWAKTRLVKIPSAGGNPTSISTYYNVRKTEGPDAIVKNDLAYTARTAIGALSGWAGALEGPRFRTGLFTMTGGNAGQIQVHYVKTTFILHLKMFERKITLQ